MPSTREAAPAPADDASPAPELPPGELACRTKQASGTRELVLEWEGGTIAKGVLRTVTPSGMIHLQKVRAERSNGLIVADDPSDSDWDLVCHTAMIGERGGKHFMRVGEGEQPWIACE